MGAGVDVEALYREKLGRRHRARPIPLDDRLWTEAERALATGEAPAQAAPARKRRAAAG
jgi:hypothetical protein